MLWQPVVKEPMECRLTIAMQLHRVSVELDNVLVNVMSVLHTQLEDLVFSVAHGVMGAEVLLELCDEFLVVVHPQRTSALRQSFEKVRFKTIEGHPRQERLCVDNLRTVRHKGKGMILKVQYTLDQEGAEFARVDPVKLVGFSDLGPKRGGRSRRMCGSRNRNGSGMCDRVGKGGDRLC
jgi:hypothetical protein